VADSGCEEECLARYTEMCYVHTFICGCPCLPLRHSESPASRNDTRFVRKRLGSEYARVRNAPCGGRATDRQLCKARFGPAGHRRVSALTDPLRLFECYALSALRSVRWVASTVTRYPSFPLDHYLISLKRRLRSQNRHPFSHKTTFSILSLCLLFLQ